MRKLGQDLQILLLLGAAGILVDVIFKSFPYAILITLICFIYLQQRNIHNFKSWAKRPFKKPNLSNKEWQRIGLLIRDRLGKSSTNPSFSKEAETLREVSDALPDASIVLDENRNITGYNRAAKRLLGINSTNLGGSLAALVEQSEFVALTKGEISDNITEFPSPLDETIRLEARYIALDQTKAVVLIRDVTQLNRLLSMRQDFIANVSHELRTPLTVIVGYLEALLNDNLDLETTREVLKKLESPSNRMQALVDDLLLLTRLEAAPKPSQNELVPIDMKRLIEQLASDGQGLSREKHQFIPEVSTDKLILGVENELHSACSNLIQNAIRYSPDGGSIKISWDFIEGIGARFSVTDEGIGIPPEHITRITERFYRIDFSKARIRGGTGLGLAIVKHVLVRHNSNLNVSSTLGEGSSFYFDFSQDQLADRPSF